MTSSSARALLILADDHRDSLEKELYRLTAPPSPAQAARIASDKLLVYQALLEAAGQLPATAQAGILVDEQYGADVAELAAHSQGLVNLSMPLEASGKEWFELEYRDDWKRHAEFFGADHAKVLIRDNPSFSMDDRRQQAERLGEVSVWAAQGGHKLIIELLVPATESDLKSVDGDKKRYDDELRPRLTLEVIRYLQDHGADPVLWKVEGMDTARDAAAIADLVRRGDRKANCIVLGRHSSKEDLDRWLGVAAPLPGYVGFAIGRSIWWDALSDLFAEKIGPEEARSRITATYLDFANAYLAARSASAD
jgi:myo-inositol catabolism protein IolC